ncbi:MAG TPA: tetratricopeptide repeat protein [Rhodocyclaceae bacterium]|nr:tetratricopeptide repeat protein [Rhodocyclaceae bacterium]
MITALIDLMGTYYQAGNPGQMAVLARSILAAIPDDIVALQFLGLALYQMGRRESARQAFAKAVALTPRRRRGDRLVTTGETASTKLQREASAPASGLSDAWRHIAHAMRALGFRGGATQAYETSLAARGLVLQAGSEAVPVAGVAGQTR